MFKNVANKCASLTEKNLLSYLKNSSKKLRKYESVVLFRRRARSGRLRRLKTVSSAGFGNLSTKNRLPDSFITEL
jgi:hypothetical protein